MSWTHQFDEDFAVEYGLNEAIIYEHLRQWIRHNAANGLNQHEGRTWTYNSKVAWQAQLPFLTSKQVRTALDNLREKKLIVVSTFNKNPWDRTLWYTLANEEPLALEGQSEQPPETNGTAAQDQSPTTPPPEKEKTTSQSSAESILAYLNEKTGKKWRATTKGNIAGIHARLKDDFTVEDCRRVIDVKYGEWWENFETRKHVNPVTLFRPANFERYLQQETRKVVVTEEAKRLCRKLADESHTAPIPNGNGKLWLADMQELLDSGAKAEDIEQAILFCWYPGNWWQGKILTPGDLKKHYSRLIAQAKALEEEPARKSR